MTGLTINKLTEHVGAEITGVDADRLAGDQSLMGDVLSALETYGVLVFPKLNPDPETHMQIARRLGDVELLTDPKYNIEGLQRLYFDPDKDQRTQYTRGTFQWHWDGCHLPIGQHPQNSLMLTARAVGSQGGDGTEFASSYHGYDLLSDTEKERYADARVLHSLATVEEQILADQLSAEDLAEKEATRVVRNAPLVWEHRSGRKSLVLGITAQRILGMSVAEGRQILDDLLQRTTAPENVYSHKWSVGDTVMWNNRGVLHRALPYNRGSERELLRATIVGDEPME